MGVEVPLHELLLDVGVGVAKGAKVEPPADDEWGLLRLGALTSGEFTASQAKRLMTWDPAYPRLEVRAGDVLMVRVNGAQSLVGASCVAKHVRPRLVLSDLMYRLVPDSERLNADFLGLMLASGRVRRQIRRGMRGTSGQFQLPQAEVKKLQVPLFPLPEQRDIVAAHEAFERRIGALERELAKVGIAESALSADVLRQVGAAGPRLDSVATVAAGVTLGSEPVGDGTIELPYLRVANVLDGRIDTTDVKTVRIVKTHYERYALRKGDLLLTEGGDLDKLGRGAVWDGRIDECLHQNHVFRVRCGEQMLPDFLALYTASPEGRAYFQRVGKQTTNLASINSTQVKQMPVPVPPVEEQRRLLGPVHAARERAAVLRRQIAKLRTIQQGVIEDLLSGQTRVNRT
ncbi:restriction endonuclease subunit S [Streptomyces sp. NPDC093250]|uniref:restriction endonuclease subunit S n=1 Tax=Streptomyces sp. NPDC093250 TaxID=3366036 RepID=UPI00381A9D42